MGDTYEAPLLERCLDGGGPIEESQDDQQYELEIPVGASMASSESAFAVANTAAARSRVPFFANLGRTGGGGLQTGADAQGAVVYFNLNVACRRAKSAAFSRPFSSSHFPVAEAPNDFPFSSI